MNLCQKICAVVILVATLAIVAVVLSVKHDNLVLPTPVAVVETTDTATLGD